ncbi:MAG: DMT family transporter [Ignisphaera sp.]
MAAQITIVIASLIWSLHPAPIYRFRQHITPITYTAFRAASAIAFLLLLLPFNTMELGGLRHTIMAIIAVSAILGPGIDDIAYTGAAQLTGSSPAVVISYTYMFIAQTIAVALLSEQIFRSTLIGAYWGVSSCSYIVVSVGIIASPLFPCIGLGPPQPLGGVRGGSKHPTSCVPKEQVHAYNYISISCESAFSASQYSTTRIFKPAPASRACG